MGDIGSCALAADSVQRRLDDCILFGVESAHTMSIDHQVACFVAMWKPGGRTIIACGKDTLIAYKNGPDMRPVTGATLGDTEGNIEEIFVPRGALTARVVDVSAIRIVIWMQRVMLQFCRLVDCLVDLHRAVVRHQAPAWLSRESPGEFQCVCGAS